MEDTREIHIQHAVPFIERHLGHRAVADDGGVVDEKIEAAKLLLDALHHGLHVIGLRDIRCDDDGTAGTNRVELHSDDFRIRLRRAEARMIQHDVRTRMVKSFCRLRANPL